LPFTLGSNDQPLLRDNCGHSRRDTRSRRRDRCSRHFLAPCDFIKEGQHQVIIGFKLRHQGGIYNIARIFKPRFHAVRSFTHAHGARHPRASLHGMQSALELLQCSCITRTICQGMQLAADFRQELIGLFDKDRQQLLVDVIEEVGFDLGAQTVIATRRRKYGFRHRLNRYGRKRDGVYIHDPIIQIKQGRFCCGKNRFDIELTNQIDARQQDPAFINVIAIEFEQRIKIKHILRHTDIKHGLNFSRLGDSNRLLWRLILQRRRFELRVFFARGGGSLKQRRCLNQYLITQQIIKLCRCSVQFRLQFLFSQIEFKYGWRTDRRAFHDCGRRNHLARIDLALFGIKLKGIKIQNRDFILGRIDCRQIHDIESTRRRLILRLVFEQQIIERSRQIKLCRRHITRRSVQHVQIE